MRGFLRHPVTVVTVAVALMSGVLSILREFLLFQYPNRFQERPLFWACVRIAFATSLVVLWYGERQKRLELEKLPEKPLSTKEQILKLSTSILEFVYTRSAGAPKISTSTPYFAGYSDQRGAIQRGPSGLTYMDTTAMEKSSQEYRTLAAF
jgi:hypothetical protein